MRFGKHGLFGLVLSGLITVSASAADIVDTAVSAGSFKTLAAALTEAGLVETLKGDGPFTVFAPTDEAFAKLDSLKMTFPEHSLKDDILYLKSKIYYKTRDFAKTAEMLQDIVDNHNDGIRADNALYELAQLYENQLNDIEKAKTLYEKLFIEYSGSTFAVDARKRYRILRGDKVQ